MWLLAWLIATIMAIGTLNAHVRVQAEWQTANAYPPPNGWYSGRTVCTYDDRGNGIAYGMASRGQHTVSYNFTSHRWQNVAVIGQHSGGQLSPFLYTAPSGERYLAGADEAGPLSILSLKTLRWRQVDYPAWMPARATLSASWLHKGRYIYFYGGLDPPVDFNDLFYYDLDLGEWHSELSLNEATLNITTPLPTKQGVAMYHPGEEAAYFFGGSGGHGEPTDMWRYDHSSRSWSRIHYQGKFGGKRNLAVTWITEDEFISVGGWLGAYGTFAESMLDVYNTTSHTWRQLSYPVEWTIDEQPIVCNFSITTTPPYPATTTPVPTTVASQTTGNSHRYNSKVFILGGWVNYAIGDINAVQVYDLDTAEMSTFQEGGVPLPDPSVDSKSIALGKWIYRFFGRVQTLQTGTDSTYNDERTTRVVRIDTTLVDQVTDAVVQEVLTTVNTPSARNNVGLAARGAVIYVVAGPFDEQGHPTEIFRFDTTTLTFSDPIIPNGGNPLPAMISGYETPSVTFFGDLLVIQLPELGFWMYNLQSNDIFKLKQTVTSSTPLVGGGPINHREPLMVGDYGFNSTHGVIGGGLNTVSTSGGWYTMQIDVSNKAVTFSPLPMQLSTGQEAKTFRRHHGVAWGHLGHYIVCGGQLTGGSQTKPSEMCYLYDALQGRVNLLRVQPKTGRSRLGDGVSAEGKLILSGGSLVTESGIHRRIFNPDVDILDLRDPDVLLGLPFCGNWTSSSLRDASSTCFHCPIGSTNPHCTMAPQGYYAPNPFDPPIACPLGTYSTTVGAASALSCVRCPGGTYNDVPGASECKSCEVDAECSFGSVSALGATILGNGSASAGIVEVSASLTTKGSQINRTNSTSQSNPGPFTDAIGVPLKLILLLVILAVTPFLLLTASALGSAFNSRSRRSHFLDEEAREVVAAVFLAYAEGGVTMMFGHFVLAALDDRLSAQTAVPSNTETRPCEETVLQEAASEMKQVQVFKHQDDLEPKSEEPSQPKFINPATLDVTPCSKDAPVLLPPTLEEQRMDLQAVYQEVATSKGNAHMELGDFEMAVTMLIEKEVLPPFPNTAFSDSRKAKDKAGPDRSDAPGAGIFKPKVPPALCRSLSSHDNFGGTYKRWWGGLGRWAFAALAIGLLLTALLNIFYFNIIETKTFVPQFVAQSRLSNDGSTQLFTANLEATFVASGPQHLVSELLGDTSPCVVVGTASMCVGSVTFSRVDVPTNATSTSCVWHSHNHTCVMKWECLGCTPGQTGSKVTANFAPALSAEVLQVQLASTTGIQALRQDEWGTLALTGGRQLHSRTIVTQVPRNGTVFSGLSTETILGFNLVPSIFISVRDSFSLTSGNEHQVTETGFHVTASGVNTMGDTVDTLSFDSVFGVKVALTMDVQQDALLIERTHRMTSLSFLGEVGGMMSGAAAIIGYIMLILLKGHNRITTKKKEAHNTALDDAKRKRELEKRRLVTPARNAEKIKQAAALSVLEGVPTDTAFHFVPEDPSKGETLGKVVGEAKVRAAPLEWKAALNEYLVANPSQKKEEGNTKHNV